MKPLIGIVGRFDSSDKFSLINVHEEYANAVMLAGGIPFLILPSKSFNYSSYDKNNYSCKELKRILDLCDGILAPGGSEIYEFDNYIYDYCVKTKKPYLGICMGMQIMIGNACLGACKGHSSDLDYVHKVNLNTESHLYKILGVESFYVNSRHLDCVLNPCDKVISATSVDGVIEALELASYPFHIGVEWHPESMISYDKKMLKIFLEFIKAAKRWKY